MTGIIILSISVLLQFIAAIIALRLMSSVGGRVIWAALSSAIILMTVRRAISLYTVISFYPDKQPSINAESIALLISALMLFAIASIRPMFIKIRRSEQSQLERNHRLRAQQAALLELATYEAISQEDLNDTLKTVTEAAARALDLDRVDVWLYGKDRLSIQCKDCYDRKTGKHQAGMEVGTTAYPAYFDALEHNLVIAVKDASVDPRTRDLVSSDLIPDGSRSVLDAPIRLGGSTVGVLCHRHSTPDRIWLLEEQNFAASLAEMVALALDQQQRKDAEADLFREKELAQVTLASIGDGVITTDINGTVEYLNPVAEQLTGWMCRDAIDKKLAEVLYVVDESTRQPVPDTLARCLRDGTSISLSGHNLLIHRSHEREYSIEVTASPIRDREQEIIGFILVFHDVTELRGMARQMTYLATHDALTGLINRREFEMRTQLALKNARKYGQRHALCYLDLDQFKVVNDTCGHIAGDHLLKRLAAQLGTVIRGSDTIARLGGDEFGVLLENCPQKKALLIADELRNVAQDFRFTWQKKVFEVGVSIGLVVIDESSGSLTDVLSAADSACYAAKDLGRNRVHLFQIDDAVLTRRQGEMQWVQRIRRAHQEGRFHLYYQPMIPLKSDGGGEFIEFLLRMEDETGEMITPGVFLPAAERYDLMSMIDQWVIQNVLVWLSEHETVMDDIESFAINLSGQSLGDDSILEFIVDKIDSSGVDPEKICFEITETAAISNLAHAIRFISILKGMGCQFALDDFGSGLSSFGYLKNLQVDYLKIDGEFVRFIVNNPLDFAMAESINQIGHVMGMKTIAEFVESDSILEAVTKMGIDYAQGNAIQIPGPLEQLSKGKLRLVR